MDGLPRVNTRSSIFATTFPIEGSEAYVMKTRVLCIVVIIALTGCVGASNKITGTAYSPHTKKVLMSTDTLPSNDEYEVIGVVKVVKGSYSQEGMEKRLADEARQIGADAVIGIRTWRAPAGFAWAAPHAEGEAIKFKPEFDVSKLNGQWR